MSFSQTKLNQTNERTKCDRVWVVAKG